MMFTFLIPYETIKSNYKNKTFSVRLLVLELATVMLFSFSLETFVQIDRSSPHGCSYTSQE